MTEMQINKAAQLAERCADMATRGYLPPRFDGDERTARSVLEPLAAQLSSATKGSYEGDLSALLSQAQSALTEVRGPAEAAKRLRELAEQAATTNKGLAALHAKVAEVEPQLRNAREEHRAAELLGGDAHRARRLAQLESRTAELRRLIEVRERSRERTLSLARGIPLTTIDRDLARVRGVSPAIPVDLARRPIVISRESLSVQYFDGSIASLRTLARSEVSA